MCKLNEWKHPGRMRIEEFKCLIGYVTLAQDKNVNKRFSFMRVLSFGKNGISVQDIRDRRIQYFHCNMHKENRTTGHSD